MDQSEKTQSSFCASVIIDMCSSAVFILDSKGKIIIGRDYRGDIPVVVIEKFYPLIIEKEEEGHLTPILKCTEAMFVYVKQNNLYRKLGPSGRFSDTKTISICLFRFSRIIDSKKLQRFDGFSIFT